MQYAQYLREGLPIASGVIEAACKTLVTQRMKQSGMAWRQAGGQAVLTLRSLIQSNRWQQAWALLHAYFCKPVKIVKTKHNPSLPQRQQALALTVVKNDVVNASYYHSLPLVT